MVHGLLMHRIRAPLSTHLFEMIADYIKEIQIQTEVLTGSSMPWIPHNSSRLGFQNCSPNFVVVIVICRKNYTDSFPPQPHPRCPHPWGWAFLDGPDIGKYPASMFTLFMSDHSGGDYKAVVGSPSSWCLMPFNPHWISQIRHNRHEGGRAGCQRE